MTTEEKQYFHLSNQKARNYATPIEIKNTLQAFEQRLNIEGDGSQNFKNCYREKENSGLFYDVCFDPQYLQETIEFYRAVKEESKDTPHPDSLIFMMKRKKYLITQTFESVCLLDGVMWEHSIAVSVKDKADQSEKDLFDIFLKGSGDPCIIGTYSSGKLNFVIEKLMDFIINDKYVFTMPKEDFVLEEPTAKVNESTEPDALVPTGTN